ncbi:AsmA-like C-terminal domain-containing protein [Roseibium sp. Sym1]|uniref:AsmA-like C-terminal domain-containing protein n=1 Tax=Roseibium sp. Sym1 TaxID=3016006 RepID=UPI0022B31E45|nr:AsmA-like C-terminal domain-containing protein [Roseibium sp. Sym1]
MPQKRKRLRLIAVAVLLCMVAGVVALFASGPVRVPMLGSLLALQGTRGPVTLEIAQASLDFTAPDGINVLVEGVQADIDGPSPVRISLPKILAPLDRDALLSGRVHFSWLDLEEPHVKVVLDGRSAKVPEMEPLMEAVDRVSDVIDDQFARRALRFVRIRSASVELAGASPRRFKGIDADIFRGDNRTIRAFAKVSGNVSTWRMELARSAPEDARQKNIGVVVNGITLAELLGPEARLVQGKGLGLPASAKIESRLSKDGKFLSANAVARVRNGWFQMGKTLVAFDDAALSLVFRRGQGEIEITRSHVIRGNTRVFFTGVLAPAKDDSGEWQISLDTEHPQFGSSDVAEAPQMMDGIQVRGRFDPQDRLLSVDRFTARSGKAVAHGVAYLQFTPEGPYLAIAAEGEQIPVALAKQLWPITLVPPARRWINERVKAGLIETLSYTGAIRPPAFDHRDPDAGWSGDDMRLDMTFTGGAVAPIGDVPEISGASGTMTVRDETLTVHATAASAKAATGGMVQVPETVFKIFNLPLREGKIAALTTRIEGEALDLGDLVNRAPFKVLDRAGLEKGGVQGEGQLDIEARFPLGKQIDLTDVDWRATGELKNFTDTNPIMGHTVAKADVSLEANREQVAIIGKGVLDGLRADIDLVVPLGESGIAARQDVVVSVTAEQLKDKGIDLTAFLDGGMTLSVAKAGDGQEFVIDLKQTEMHLLALGWQKAKGVPATASFKLLETDGQRKVTDFKLVSEGVDVTGYMNLSAAGDLVRAEFDTFKLRPGDDVEVDIQRASDGRYDIIFAGPSFDSRGLIRSLRSPGGSKGAGDFSGGARIAATIDRVIGFNNQSIDKFTGHVETGAKGLVSADLKGKVNDRSNFEFVVTEQNGTQTANGRFANTGATLRFLDLYERMRGGTGSLSVAMADEDSWVGDFNVRSLRITEDPAIRRIRERDNRSNLNPDGSVVRARGETGSASFDTLDISFSRDGDLMTISRGALRGNALGGTVSGTVDLDQQTLNLTGTFVPIYAINNFFAKIPLLGFALGGNSGEGLIGVTYRLSGSVSDPDLSVNPISAIAPGIFRKMFEFQPN